MAGITLLQAQTALDLWLAADAAVASGQSYRIGERELRRTDAGEIRKNIDYWDSKVKTLSYRTAGRSRARTVVAG
jgi:hypothetical protein